MTPEELTQRRSALGFTQARLADLLGMSLRGYRKLESGEAPIRFVYQLALDRLGLIYAVEERRIEAATDVVRRDALLLADLIRGS